MAVSMRAAWYERQGPPAEVLQVGELTAPEPGRGEVRVRVHASGVNPSDTYGRAGIQGPMPFPRIVPHQDGAGVIESVGEGVPPQRVGERVWIYEATYQRQWGTAAQLSVVPTERAVPLPDGLSFEEGACLGVPAMTAHRAVFADGPVRNKVVLVTGGAGSVGRYAIQLARWGGAAQVLATVSSPEKAEVARAAGADATVNYREAGAAEAIKRLAGGGVDHIAEVDLGGNLATTLQILNPYASVVAYASRGNPEPAIPWRALAMRNVTLRPILVYTMPPAAKQAAIADIAAASAQGALTHQIATRFPLDRIAAAHELVESWSAVGHIVLTIAA